MARSIITPAHMEEKGKKLEVGYPPALCLILRRLSAIRLVRDAKHLFRVCRLEGCARHAALVTTLRGPPPGALAGYRREATEIREKRFSIRGNSIGISPFSLRCARQVPERPRAPVRLWSKPGGALQAPPKAPLARVRGQLDTHREFLSFLIRGNYGTGHSASAFSCKMERSREHPERGRKHTNRRISVARYQMMIVAG